MSEWSIPTSIDDVPRADLIKEDVASFAAFLKSHKINADEYQVVKSIMARPPTLAELGVFSAMWSEHCSYKSSRVHLKNFPTTGPEVVVGPGENAGVVRLSGKLCVAFKMESHNHPSYIEPYQGAATGVGGILRDVFCMGARPIANLNCLRFGERSHPKTSYLLQHVVKGIGDYGNCVGIPTVGGNISFDKSYNGNCLVNAMTVGVIHEDRIFKGYAKGEHNLVIYVGSSTGRDGIHGATMASDSFASEEEGERSAVQVGDPFTEKMLMEATLEVLEKNLVVGLQDMGAAGLTSSSFEMAERAGNGLFIDLDRIPVRTANMSAYELLLSESQERMLMVVESKNWDALQQVFEKWQLSYNVIGSVTQTGRVQAVYKGFLELDMPVNAISERAPKYNRPIKKPVTTKASPGFHKKCLDAIANLGAEKTLLTLLQDTGEKSFIFEQYDQDIGTKTVLSSRQGGAAILWPRSPWVMDQPHLGLAIATSCNERYCYLDPKAGAAHAVLKAAKMMIATGATPLAVTDCLNYGNPEDPAVMGQFAAGVEGISEACIELKTPVVSGNVSLYNETDGLSISPTPMIGMVGKLADARNAIKAILSERSAMLCVLSSKEETPTFGASLVAKNLGLPLDQDQLPALDWSSQREAQEFLTSWDAKEQPFAVRDVADGGLVTCITKMCLAAGLGYVIDLQTTDLSSYFAERSCSYVLAFRNEQDCAKAQKRVASFKRLQLINIGSADKNLNDFSFGTWRVSKQTAQAAYSSSLEF